MKNLIVACIILLAGTSIQAQDYQLAAGLRGGFNSGITVKKFIGGNSAVEGIIASRWDGFVVTGLYELHSPSVFDTPGLNAYYGVGGHIGFWDGDNVKWTDDSGSHTVIGVDGILGIEYNFNEFPINISLDWKPVFNIIGHSGFWGDNGAFSIRYIFR